MATSHNLSLSSSSHSRFSFVHVVFSHLLSSLLTAVWSQLLHFALSLFLNVFLPLNRTKLPWRIKRFRQCRLHELKCRSGYSRKVWPFGDRTMRSGVTSERSQLRSTRNRLTQCTPEGFVRVRPSRLETEQVGKCRATKPSEGACPKRLTTPI